MIRENTINEFLTKLGSSSATPGGGSASALTGAIGVSLGKMVAELTVGKEKYKNHEDLNKTAIKKLNHFNSELLNLANADIDGYNKVMDAYRLPKMTEQEVKNRNIEIQESLKNCTIIPSEVMVVALNALEIVINLLGKSNQNAHSDLLVAISNLNTAITGAKFSVETNLKNIDDSLFVEKYDVLTKSILLKKDKYMAQVFPHIENESN